MNESIQNSIEDYDNVIEEIRKMAASGNEPSKILKFMILSKNIEGKAQLMHLFINAFSMKLKDTTCIGGWWHDDASELKNKDINNFLSPHINLWLKKQT